MWLKVPACSSALLSHFLPSPLTHFPFGQAAHRCRCNRTQPHPHQTSSSSSSSSSSASASSSSSLSSSSARHLCPPYCVSRIKHGCEEVQPPSSEHLDVVVVVVVERNPSKLCCTGPAVHSNRKKAALWPIRSQYLRQLVREHVQQQRVTPIKAVLLCSPSSSSSSSSS